MEQVKNARADSAAEVAQAQAKMQKVLQHRRERAKRQCPERVAELRSWSCACDSCGGSSGCETYASRGSAAKQYRRSRQLPVSSVARYLLKVQKLQNRAHLDKAGQQYKVDICCLQLLKQGVVD